MDLEEWELLPMNNNNNNNNNHGFNTKKTLDPKNPRNVLDMDYFICPSQDLQSKTEFPNQRSTVVPTTHLLQVPKSWEPIINTTDDSDNDHGGKIIKTPNPDPEHDPGNPDPVPSPRVSFKKMKENEFVDMKIDPVLMRTTNSSPLPQIENKKPFESSDGGFEERRNEIESEGEKLNIWKLGLTGIGAICSFGVAAATATFCIIFMGSNNNKKGFKNKNQLLQFQIYSDDKRMKEAVKLNEAISVMKGVPMARARISFGGYYDGL